VEHRPQGQAGEAHADVGQERPAADAAATRPNMWRTSVHASSAPQLATILLTVS